MGVSLCFLGWPRMCNSNQIYSITWSLNFFLMLFHSAKVTFLTTAQVAYSHVTSVTSPVMFPFHETTQMLFGCTAFVLAVLSSWNSSSRSCRAPLLTAFQFSLKCQLFSQGPTLPYLKLHLIHAHFLPFSFFLLSVVYFIISLSLSGLQTP
jgi:hypothetical protein